MGFQRLPVAGYRRVQRRFRPDVVGGEPASRGGYPPGLQDPVAFAQRQAPEPERDMAALRKVVVQMVYARHDFDPRPVLFDAERAVEIFVVIAGGHSTRYHDVARDGEGRPGEFLAQLPDGRRDGLGRGIVAALPEPGVVAPRREQGRTEQRQQSHGELLFDT